MGGLSEELNASFDKLMTIERDVGSEKVRVKSGVANEWKDIPMELLLQIVSLVDHRTVIIASGVCRGWRESLSRGLTHLSLTWCKKSMNNLVLGLAPKFRKLETLILRQVKAQLEDSGVEAISEYCHELQILDLSKSFKLTDKSLFSLARGCQNLTTLNISGCSAFGDASVAHLVSRCRKLKVLNLCGCVGAVSDTVLQAIGSHCNQLEYLNIGWCEKVTDVGVLSLAYGCPDLRNLDLCACSLITDESVVGLARRCVRLRSLGLYYCQNITDRAMYSLAQSRVRPAKKEEGLAALNISQCTALTPPAVQALCDTFPALHTCPRHSSLIMSGCLSLTSVHCACTSVAVHPNIPNSAH